MTVTTVSRCKPGPGPRILDTGRQRSSGRRPSGPGPAPACCPSMHVRAPASSYCQVRPSTFELTTVSSKHSKPYFEGLREKEEEAGGSGWDARKQKSAREFLQRVSITIAKGNSRVLDCMRHDWQSSTAPDLVRVTSTVHNPRTLAATSDPGTHDPTAATPAGGP